MWNPEEEHEEAMHKIGEAEKQMDPEQIMKFRNDLAKMFERRTWIMRVCMSIIGALASFCFGFLMYVEVLRLGSVVLLSILGISFVLMWLFIRKGHFDVRFPWQYWAVTICLIASFGAWGYNVAVDKIEVISADQYQKMQTSETPKGTNCKKIMFVKNK